MTKKEQQNIAKSLYKTLQPMRISREQKEQIYYAVISGMAMNEGFNEDYLLGYDIVMDGSLRDYKQRNKDKLITA
jgi:2-keto-4-pentenoate hydratase/2-oxohepta-3-ene-1,7-dioic acid hydratase in catechol pathway